MSTIYSSLDVYRFSSYSNLDQLNIALDQDDNSNNWYRDENGYTALHAASIYGHIDIVYTLLEKGIGIIEIESNNGNKALNCACSRGRIECIELFFNKGAEIDEDDIDGYAPETNDDDDNNDDDEEEVIDCRPMILYEIRNRRKRRAFDSFIIRYIEFNPFIGKIYNRCFPSGNIRVATPEIGWGNAESILNQHYLEEVSFNLHMHIANFYTNHQSDAVITTSFVNSMNHAARNSDKTSTLMIILTDRLKLMLKAEIDDNNDDNNDDD